MSTKGTVFIVLISVFIWGISIYNGWLKEVVIFGYNMFDSFVGENKSQISTNDDVTTVKYGEFAYKLLTNITVPDNITTVENNAFKGNKLTSITLGSNVSLGENAFGFGFEYVYNANDKYAGTYTRDDANSNYWSIWDGNYQYQVNYRNIIITDYSGTDSTVIIPDEINGRSVTMIAKRAFRRKNLTSVTIPASVTSIEEGAFRDNRLSSVNIPFGVTNIGEYSFGANQLTRIVIPNTVKNIGVNAFAENQIISIRIGEGVSIGNIGSGIGILGEGTGFNTAYFNNNRRAGTYARPNIRSTTWTRSAR
jgi:hypothetical protein